MDLHQQLTPHFKLVEFLHNGSSEGLTDEIVQNLHKLAEALEQVRVMCGNRPISIDSGLRTPEHNKAVGGVPDSQHLIGKAADIQVEGWTPRQVQAVLLAHHWPGGLGLYKTWTHVDIWETNPPRRWEGS